MTKAFEPLDQFEQRKQDHIELALKPENQAHSAGFERIKLIHEALPDVNFDDICINTTSLAQPIASPFVVSSMTAGHEHAKTINNTLAKACATKGWAMGVGSQRRQLHDKAYAKEWHEIIDLYPTLEVFANIGIAQAIHMQTKDIQALIESINAKALFIHLNPLQEIIQQEGTTNFKNGLKAIETICNSINIPVIIKETGCGFSEKTLKSLDMTGIKAVDLSGFGGTHWGRIEGMRAKADMNQQAAKTFANWGISTIDSMINAIYANPHYEIWASGGVRTGLDAAKLLAMGAKRVGFAKPMLEAALENTNAVIAKMEHIEFELRTALFCTGFSELKSFSESEIWRIQP